MQHIRKTLLSLHNRSDAPAVVHVRHAVPKGWALRPLPFKVERQLNVQLVTLRNVRTAGELSRHLAKKMEELSARLQQATLASADLRQTLMTRLIRVQDAVAELTLEQPPDQTSVAKAVAPPS